MSALKQSVLRDIATNVCNKSTKGCGRGKKGVADLISNVVASGEVAKAAKIVPKKHKSAKKRTRSRSRTTKPKKPK